MTPEIKILLISANRYDVPYPVYPLGVATLDGYLKKYLPGSEVRIFDAGVSGIAMLSQTLKNFNPDYIGLSLRNVDNNNYYDNLGFSEEYVKIVKIIRHQTKSTIVVGGSGFSIFPEKMMQLIRPDFGIAGEGEDAFLELITRQTKKESCNNIPGLIYFSGNKLQINPPEKKAFIREFHLCFNKKLNDYYWKNSGMLNVQTKRGCPYKCIYCSYPLIEGKKVRTLDHLQVADYLQTVYRKGINHVFFTDSVFNINDDYNVLLAEEIIRRKIKMEWSAYFTPFNLNAGSLKLFKKAGLTHIEFGTDSLSAQQLKNYGKCFSPEEVLASTKLCNKLDIYCAHFLILGGVGENLKSLKETFRFSSRFGKTVFFPFIGMRIYPGTQLEKIAIKEKKIPAQCDLLEPMYYISEKIDIDVLKELAGDSGKPWIFPDEDLTPVIKRLRNKNKKGPLWHYLVR